MNKLIFYLTALILLSNCSFNNESKIWNDKKNKLDKNKNVIKVLEKKKDVVLEFNEELLLDLSFIKLSSEILNDQNNLGSQSYQGKLEKIGSYKFSKFDKISQLNFIPIFLDNGIIFFDKKGSVIRYDKNQKIVWKKNYYLRSEKKIQPKLNFLMNNENIIITDNLAKFYSINLINGDLIWTKNNPYPFNSEIKKNKENFFVVDYKNFLRCYKILDGTECWNLQTEDSFTVSNSKYSLIIFNDNVVFSNSLGDITAVDIESGLVSWQLPTQNSSIINETYNFKTSKLVSDNKSIFFSNNKNEFYSINGETGNINWVNKINSNLKPILLGNFIFTISNEGFLYVIEKNSGNIIRVTDLFKNYKNKKRKNIYPIGFAIGGENLFLTVSDGKMIVSSIKDGKIIKFEKVSSGPVSEPFIFDGNLYIVRSGSIVKYN